MVDQARLAQVAKRLIESNGRSVEFRVKPGTLKDAAQPWLGKAAAGSTSSVICVFVDYRASEIDGSIVQREDRRLLVAGESIAFVPSTDYEVIDGAVVWQVVNVQQVQPGSVEIMYDLQVRA